ncbi:MAG TPA: PEP-CTERM sorting domain-containing protein [Fimbriimonadaceae bacterium]|nr:PEP-CTERM sorting domain-containing protein [Fimbriimonadaceae bacterium]
MKRFAILALALSSVAAQAVVVFDSIGAGTAFGTTTGGLPRNRMAEDVASMLDPGTGNHWLVRSIDVSIWVQSGTPTNVTAEVILWNSWNGAGHSGAGTNVFANEAGRETFNLGDLTGAGVRTLTFTNGIHLSAFTNVGVEIQLKTNGTKSDTLALSLQDAAPTVGTSNNAFYRDADNDEVIETTDGRVISGWTNTNTMMRIHADAVPEPATMAALGLGTLALLRRRRK